MYIVFSHFCGLDCLSQSLPLRIYWCASCRDALDFITHYMVVVCCLLSHFVFAKKQVCKNATSDFNDNTLVLMTKLLLRLHFSISFTIWRCVILLALVFFVSNSSDLLLKNKNIGF